MAVVIFYEKPGCCGNARQKTVLEASGHSVMARSLLQTRWSRGQLRSFLEPLPVAQWFNPSSPRVKRGEIVPGEVDKATALGLLLADPLLIRRPLLEVDGVRRAGFDAAAIDGWIGLSAWVSGERLDACAHAAGNVDNGPQCGAGHGDHRHEPSLVDGR